MSSRLPLIVALGVLAVAMVTGAPLANSQAETVVSDAQPDASVVRAKRADEKIFFDNEQNAPRTVVKKSNLDSILTPAEPQGEQDEGSEVIVHKEQPVGDEMKTRIEAAQRESVESQELPQELEESMHSIVTSVLNDELENQASQEHASESVEELSIVPDTGANEEEAEEEDVASRVEEVDTPAGDIEKVEEVVETADAPEDEAKEEEEGENKLVEEIKSETETDPQADDEEKELLEIGSDQDGSENPEALQENELVQGDGSAPSGGATPYAVADDPYAALYDYYVNLNKAMYYPRAPVVGPLGRIDPARYRRSAIASLAKSRRVRRIKRDLLDDLYQSPALSYPPSMREEDQEEYIPLTEDEAAVLYGRLLDYLEDVLAEEEAEEAREEENSYQSDFFPEESEFQEQPSYLSDPYSSEIMSSPYDDGYPYGPIDLDTYNSYAKRSRMPYYPYQEKRYFFPVNEEPDTHWGAFVPEKRDYRDSISRLQRLAMALDDNPGPYYREVIDEYRKKK